MTGNQPGQDLSLPRPALLPNVPLNETIEHMFFPVKARSASDAGGVDSYGGRSTML
jgi:hypothetical protein